MFSGLISKLSTKFLLSAIGLLVGIVVTLAIYSYFASSNLESANKKLVEKELEIQMKDEEFEKAKKIYEENLALEKEIIKQNTITELERQQVTKTRDKLKEAVIKRGEIKEDEKSNFTIVDF